jgi:hypothetical protein
MNFTATCCSHDTLIDKGKNRSYGKFFIRSPPDESASEEEQPRPKGNQELQDVIANTLENFKIELMKDFKTELIGNLKEELIGTLKEELIGTLKEELMGNLKEELIGTLKTEFLGNLKEELIGTLQIEFLGNLKAELIGALQTGTAPAINDAFRTCVDVQDSPNYIPFFNKSEYITRDCQASFGEDGTLTLQVGLAGRLFEAPVIYPFGDTKVALEGPLLESLALIYEDGQERGEMITSLKREETTSERWYLEIESLRTSSGHVIDFEDIHLPFKVSFTGSLYETT